MFTQLFSIARNAFVEGLRQPIFLVLLLLAGVLQVLTTWSTGFSMGYEDTSEAGGDNKLMLDFGLASVFVLGTLLAAFVATAVVNREIENKTVLTVVSKPVGRPVLVLGKYLGVAGAILLAVVTMLIFLMFGIRHGVMSTAADVVDQPVVVFSVGAVGLSILLAAWCNFFYGWSFPQTAVVLMLPLCLVGYVLVLSLNKEWHWQSLGKDFKPQILLACACLVMAVLVLTAVATAASTRLGQVMTIVVCAGVLIGSMLSNYFIGRHAFSNRMVATVRTATPDDPTHPAFDRAGDTFHIELEKAPTVGIRPGSSFYYGPSPNGAFLSVPEFGAFQGRLDDSATFLAPGAESAIVVTAVDGLKLTVRNLGHRPVPVSAPPMPGDFVFLTPTHVHFLAMIPWAVIPNMQYFWLLDAVSQNQKIPPSHVAEVAIYGALQVGALLALAVVLFQRRDVG